MPLNSQNDLLEADALSCPKHFREGSILLFSALNRANLTALSSQVLRSLEGAFRIRRNGFQ